jgi:uncharacterized protein YkwD
MLTTMLMLCRKSQHRTQNEWHQRHLRVLLLLAALILASTVWFSGSEASSDSLWEESYVSASDLAAVYGTEQDAIGLVAANELLLDMTNEARHNAGLPTLAWDELAASAAQQHAGEMVREHYPGHYNLAGQKCEMRFNLVGGTAHVSENYAYYEVAHAIHLTPQLIERMMQHWLDSPSHSARIFSDEHTGMGCGVTLVHDTGITYVAGVVEFVNDYGDHQRLPARATAGDMLLVTGVIAPELACFAYVGIGIEPLPTERDPVYQRENTGNYSPPEVLLALAPCGKPGVRQPPPVIQRRYVVEYDDATGEYAVQLTLLPGCLQGAYYITTWAEPLPVVGEFGNAHAICAMTQVVLVE